MASFFVAASSSVVVASSGFAVASSVNAVASSFAVNVVASSANLRMGYIHRHHIKASSRILGQLNNHPIVVASSLGFASPFFVAASSSVVVASLGFASSF